MFAVDYSAAICVCMRIALLVHLYVCQFSDVFDILEFKTHSLCSLLVIGSAGRVICISRSKCCLCVWMSTRVTQIVTGCTQWFVMLLAQTWSYIWCTSLLMNSACTLKTRSVWPTLRVKVTCWKSGRKFSFPSHLSLLAHGMLVCFILSMKTSNRFDELLDGTSSRRQWE